MQREVEKGGSKRKNGSREENAKNVARKALEKSIEQLPQKRERKNGKKSDKKGVISYLPPFFFQKRAFFIEKNQVASAR